MNEININVSKLLDGQIVLVTGAGQGNGRAIAKGIARSGAHVVVTDVQLDIGRGDGAADSFGRRGSERLSSRRDRSQASASLSQSGSAARSGR